MELTKEEARFVIELLNKVNTPLLAGDAAQSVALAQSVARKCMTVIEADDEKGKGKAA